jgi:glyceraldehyde 3-phosphate dehydrogenase
LTAIGINGFGRIGRVFLRALIERNSDLRVVAVNDLADPEVNAHLLKYDTTHKTFKGEVRVDSKYLIAGDQKITMFCEKDPEKIPWQEAGADIVVESTGRFTSKDSATKHIAAGAKKVIISAPSPDSDITVVVGVNSDSYDPDKHSIISNASCTTNCIVPMAKVLEDNFGIVSGLMTTAHAMTNDQNLLDLIHKDLRRARSAPFNIVPTSTGAARATKLVLHNMGDRLDGVALRVPVIDGSITDFTAVINAKADEKEVNAAFKRASESNLKGILSFSEDPLVSSDIVGSPYSCIFDSLLTMTKEVGPDMTLVKIFGWYDNEWGYVNRLVDLCELVSRGC